MADEPVLLEDEFDAVVDTPGTEVLPPSGDEQREALKKRKDKLEQKAEELSEQAEFYSFDPSKLEMDNEIAQHFNALEVTDKVPGYKYVWVNYMSVHGRGVTHKLSKRVKGQPVWEVVRNEMPECKELEAVDGTRRIGDVLLMRGRIELVEQLEYADYVKSMRQQDAIESNLLAMGDKYSKYGVKVYKTEEMDPKLMNNMQTSAQAKQAAQRMTDQWIREGKMPGAAMRKGA